MRSILILSLILAFTITNAQDRKDTIRMKDGAEILCQILKVSKPDSIQFCIRENGELKVKKFKPHTLLPMRSPESMKLKLIRKCWEQKPFIMAKYTKGIGI